MKAAVFYGVHNLRIQDHELSLNKIKKVFEDEEYRKGGKVVVVSCE